MKFRTTFWPALNTRFCRTSRGEAGDLDLHAVAAFGRQRADHVAAAVVGGHGPRQAGGGVLDGDGRARQHRLLRVGDDAFDVERGVLRECRTRGDEQRDEEQRKHASLPGCCTTHTWPPDQSRRTPAGGRIVARPLMPVTCSACRA